MVILDIIVSLVLLSVIVIVILLLTGVIKIYIKKDPKDPNKRVDSERSNYTYIDPAPFNIGPIKDGSNKPANICESSVLFPIQQLSPDYGSKMPEHAPCYEFIQPP